MSLVKQKDAPIDAAQLASIRWYACLIEIRAIERYLGNRAAAGKLQHILAEALSKLEVAEFTDTTKYPPAVPNPESMVLPHLWDCPWPVSADGKCEPPNLKAIVGYNSTLPKP